MDLLEIMRNRRSVRKYTGERIDDEKIEKVLQAGMLSASSKGRRPWEFIVVRSKETLEKMAHSRVAGAAMLKGADTAIAVIADPEKCDVWVEDCSIVMANMHLMADSLGLGSCWIHRAKEEFETPEGKAILEKFGVNGDFEGIGHLIVGYTDGAYPETKPRNTGRVFEK